MNASGVSLVVPVFNDGRFVLGAQQGLHDACSAMRRPFEIIYVDDGSTDRTWSAIVGAVTQDDRTRGLRLGANVGQAGAIAAGIRRCSEAIVVTTDVDLETEPLDLHRLIAAIEGGHAVASGRRTSPRSWKRELPSRIFNAYVRHTGIHLHDIGCGSNAMTQAIGHSYIEVLDLRRELPTAVLATLTDDMVEVPMRSKRPASSQLATRDLAMLWQAFEVRRRQGRGYLAAAAARRIPPPCSPLVIEDLGFDAPVAERGE